MQVTVQLGEIDLATTHTVRLLLLKEKTLASVDGKAGSTLDLDADPFASPLIEMGLTDEKDSTPIKNALITFSEFEIQACSLP
jgi:hypothetical protein